MSGRAAGTRWTASAPREQVPGWASRGRWDETPPIAGGHLSTLDQLRFEVADASAVARATAGHLSALGVWLRHLPSRSRTRCFAAPDIAAAAGSLRDVYLALDFVDELLGALGRLADEAGPCDTPLRNGQPDIFRNQPSTTTPEGDDVVDPTSLPTGALISALSSGVRGDYAQEAAVDLLARFGCPSGFWLRRPGFLDNCVEVWLAVAPEDTTGTLVHRLDARIDGAALAVLLNAHRIEGAAGELRVLHLVAGLLGYPTGRPLSEQLAGLDEDTTVLVLRAVAHVGGWHERGRAFVLAGRDIATEAPADLTSGVGHE